MVATAHPLDSIIGHIRTLADSYIPTNPIRSSRTVSHQQDVLQDSYGQNDIKDSLAQTGAAVDSLLPSATATKTVAIVPIATPTSLFEDIYEDEEDDVSYASSTSTSSSDPFIDSSISRRRVRSKRQNSGVGNVGNGNSGNYNCGNGNYPILCNHLIPQKTNNQNQATLEATITATAIVETTTVATDSLAMEMVLAVVVSSRSDNL